MNTLSGGASYYKAVISQLQEGAYQLEDSLNATHYTLHFDDYQLDFASVPKTIPYIALIPYFIELKNAAKQGELVGKATLQNRLQKLINLGEG